MAKYKNKKVTVDGITFDSKKEANRYKELKALEQAGAILDLRLQVKYTLIPAQRIPIARFGKNGKRLKDHWRTIEKECAYIADFVYYDCNADEVVVEDTKGVKTKDYIIKRKLMLWVHNIRIEEV